MAYKLVIGKVNREFDSARDAGEAYAGTLRSMKAIVVETFPGGGTRTMAESVAIGAPGSDNSTVVRKLPTLNLTPADIEFAAGYREGLEKAVAGRLIGQKWASYGKNPNNPQFDNHLEQDLKELTSFSGDKAEKLWIEHAGIERAAPPYLNPGVLREIAAQKSSVERSDSAAPIRTSETTKTVETPNRGPAFGITQIDDKPATSLRYERVEQEGHSSYNVSFYMGSKVVAKAKDLDVEALTAVVGEKNAKSIIDAQELKGSLKGESLQSEYGLTPEEQSLRLEKMSNDAAQRVLANGANLDDPFEYEIASNMSIEQTNLDLERAEFEKEELPSTDHEVDLPEEQNTIEHVPEIEQVAGQAPVIDHAQAQGPELQQADVKTSGLESVDVQEALARAAFNRQRDRDQLTHDQEKLGQRTEGKRVDVERLSEQATDQTEGNEQAERTGATTDYESQQLTEREKNRQMELLEQVHNQFRVSGPKFHFKDQPGKLAFKDKGERMVSASNDERVAKAMATMAEAKGWKTIKVSGHPDFQKEVWMEASLRGIEVRGYKPTEQDLQMLEARRDRTLNNKVERDIDRERAPSRTASEPARERNAAGSERTSTPKTAREATTTDKSKAVGEGKPTPEQAAAGVLRAFSGKVVEHGPANFNHDPDEKMNYFVKLETAQGEKTVWGVDLKRAMDEGKVKPGDEVNLENLGQRPVEVEALKRDDKGKIVGREIIETNRNEWQAKKSDRALVVEAVAAKIIGEKVTDPAQQAQLKAAVGKRLAEREQQKRVPGVAIYDKDAQAQQPERSGPVVERNAERTR